MILSTDHLLTENAGARISIILLALSMKMEIHNNNNMKKNSKISKTLIYFIHIKMTIYIYVFCTLIASLKTLGRANSLQIVNEIEWIFCCLFHFDFSDIIFVA